MKSSVLGYCTSSEFIHKNNESIQGNEFYLSIYFNSKNSSHLMTEYLNIF